MTQWHQLDEIEQSCLRAAAKGEDNGGHIQWFRNLENGGLISSARMASIAEGKWFLKFSATPAGIRCLGKN